MNRSAADIPPGLIDIHSHILPGIDDGCQSLEESLACLAQLQAAGFVGSICTPHVWIDRYPHNTVDNIAARTTMLQGELQSRGIDYRLWAGGEVRLCKSIVKWMQHNGVPTLAGTRIVLIDLWETSWPKWATKAIAWLISEGYQPILAHPERLPDVENIADLLTELTGMGVWLQGNAACMTGEEGYHADQIIRHLLGRDLYKLIALDMHGPDTLPSRLDGLKLIEIEFGADKLDQFINRAPRELVFGAPATA